MDFSSEADVEMMHDGDLLGGGGGMQFGHHHQQQQQHHHVQQQQAHHSQQQLAMGGLVIDTQQGGGFGANPFGAAMIPGLAPGALQPQQVQGGQGAFPSSVEEYAALMGIKLEGPNDELPPSTPMAHLAPSSGSAFNLQPAPDMAKIQANTDYFENLYRRASNELDVSGGGGATSMTLPAGIGSGVNAANMFPGGIPGVVPASSPLYDRTSELAFGGDMNRMYDPSSGYAGGAPVHAMHKPNMMVLDKFAPRGMMPHQHESLGSQTLSPEMLSAMIKSNNGHSFSTFVVAVCLLVCYSCAC